MIAGFRWGSGAGEAAACGSGKPTRGKYLGARGLPGLAQRHTRRFALRARSVNTFRESHQLAARKSLRFLSRYARGNGS
jgi:hypothetical protein